MARSTRGARIALRFRPTMDRLETRRQLSGSTVTNALMVRFRDSADASTIAEALRPLGATVAVSYEGGPKQVVLGPGVAQWYALRVLNASPSVVYAEADGTITVSASVTPNDSRYSQLWGLNNANDVDINAPEAWSITAGSSAVVVAVLDTGIDITHPDLASKIWVNTAEINGNRVDDDSDGYVDDYYGWNFVSNTNDVRDNNGHGSHVSGTIAASSNNGVGVTGVSWNAQIMPLKILDAQGNGTDSAAVAAIYFAANKGAKIINASWGGGSYSQAMVDAIRYAGTKGVIFVAAAGNEATNTDVSPSYPADYDLSNILSVAAVDSSGNLASFSNYGVSSVDLAAPGVGIVSTINGGRYSTYSGTSMATPHVSGVLALVLSVAPNKTPEQLAALLKQTVKPLAALDGKMAYGGIVDAYAALLAATGTTSTSTPPVTPTTPTTPTPPTTTPTTPTIPTTPTTPTPPTTPTTPTTPTAPTDVASVAGSLPLAPGKSKDDDVRASIFSSNEYLAAHGGTTAGFLTGLYNDVMGRTPDSAGLAYFTGLIAGGATRVQVASWFMESGEGQATKVARWYQSDLGRTATLADLKTDEGVVAYSTLMANGGAGDAQVRSWILGSTESFNRNGKNNTSFVSNLYQNLLGRSVDVSGLVQYAGLLDNGLANRGDVIVAILGSAEGKATKVATWYQQGLGRPSSLTSLKLDGGVIGWAAYLGNV